MNGVRHQHGVDFYCYHADQNINEERGHMKVILTKANQLVNRRCSSANGLFTFRIVGAVTSLILMFALGLTGIGGIGVSDVSAASTISVSSSGAQSIDVSPGASGVGTSIGVDEITVNTTCRAGYNFSLSTSVNDNNLYLNGNSSNNESGKYFTPSDGTTSLGSSTNIWGYYYNSSAPTTAPTSADIFPAVPSLSSTTAIIKTPATTASSTDISDSFNIYYGVSASSNLIPGTYKMIPDTNNSNADGSIVYYVTMDTSCDVYTISYNANNGNGSIESQEVSSGGSVVLADNAFTRANHYFMGWSTNQNATTPEYRTNQTITPTSDMTLYAVWGDSTTTTLYDAVASLTKGAQPNDASTVANTGDTIAGIQAAITKANSGVYTYDANTYGAASDAATTNPIYYYRGILDTNLDGTTNTYGTNGDGMDYPNYVILDADGTKDTSDTCWRIVRTTGSGGVKMIYNGMYGNTTAGSCANPTTAAQIRSTSATTADSTATFTSAFAGTSAAQYRSIVGVGYTRNNTYASTSATTATVYSTLFGTNSSYSGNSTNSTIKGYIETWFANNLNSYASILESSAGYCNDRSIRSSSSSTSLIEDSTTIVPYGTSSMTTYYFGPYVRNATASDKPTLNCPRNVVDLYTTSSASDGNKQLSKPVALLTADEVQFAGSGRSTASQGSAYHHNSYLRSGSNFWLLSPGSRSSSGYANGFYLISIGDLYNNYVNYTFGVRPAISLISGTTATSGSGTATDPWVVTAPAPGLCTDAASCMQTATTCDTPLTDSRTGVSYLTATINNQCYMEQNLYLPTGLKLTSSDSNVTRDWTTPTASLTAGSSYTEARMVAGTHADETYDATGGWYNYCAASAGTVCSETQADASEDICPAGWRLPTETEMDYVKSANRSNWEFYAGYYYGGSLRSSSSYSYWWSTTAYNANYQISLRYYNGSLNTTNKLKKSNGFFVRCVRD